MMYKFIRTGDKPVEECAGADVIKGCFEPCDSAVKARLDKFLNEGQESITFAFDTSTVTVRRVKNCRDEQTP